MNSILVGQKIRATTIVNVISVEAAAAVPTAEIVNPSILATCSRARSICLAVFILRRPVRAAQEIGDLPDQVREVVVIRHGSLP